MGIGFSLFLIAAGAALRWAVTDAMEGVSLATVGTILLVVGVVGLVISLVLWGPRSDRRVRRERVVDDRGRGYERTERVDGL
jgi:hypothetical protein